ncbi:MAG: hypothetical protein C0403_09160 [Desulfobacterium sp.]|nr:hypothetical protein [Desulfobacterium sp.]
MKRYILCTILLVMSGVLYLPVDAVAHGGEDHGGESLAGNTGSILGAPIFVSVETQIRMGIKTALVQKKKLPKQVKALGRTRIRPELEAVISSPVEGRLVSAADYVQPKLGENVRKGQIIAVVDQTISGPDAINLSIEQTRIQSELSQAQTDLAMANKEYERVLKLKDVVPDKEIWRAETALTIARERHDGLKKQGSVYETSVDQPRYQSTNPKRVIIKAPLDGIIAETHVTLGEYVRLDKELYHIINLSEVLVEADVFENSISLVSHATYAKVIVEAYPNDIFTGKLVSIGTTIDPQTRTLKVLFLVPNTGLKLVAQMFADVFIETGESFEGLTIPKTALVNQDDQSVIYVKTSGEQFVARPVIVAERYMDSVLLSPDSSLSIKEGERVVIQGMYQIRMSASMPEAPKNK